MAVKNLVKGICDTSKCNYDVYTKDRTDELLAEKQATLTFDNTPTADSNNPVKSGGVYTALGSKANTSDIPTKTSDLTNDSSFITNSVNNLTNYENKTKVYGTSTAGTTNKITFGTTDPTGGTSGDIYFKYS